MKLENLRIFELETIIDIQAEAIEYAFIKTKLGREIADILDASDEIESLTSIDNLIDESMLTLKVEELKKYTIIEKTKEEYAEILKDSKRFDELSMHFEEEEWLGYMDAISEEDLDYEKAEDEEETKDA